MSLKGGRVRFDLRFLILGLVLGLATFAAARLNLATAADSAATLRIEPSRSPAGINSSEPQFTGHGTHIILNWLEVTGQHAVLKYAKRIPSGWSSPQTIISGDNFFINSSDVPSVREMMDGTIVAQWLQHSGPDVESDAYDIRLSWSKDQGHTWSRPAAPHHDGTKTQHGFASLFQPPGAGFGLAWLDGRATNPDNETGDMALRASVYDANYKQVTEVIVAPRVCECCATSVAETSEGVIVAYRNRTANEVRDIYVSRLTEGRWSPGTTVHDDGWRIEACPINGPSIAARGREVAVAWFTAKEDHGQSFVAFSQDAGRTFGPPFRVDDSDSNGRVSAQLLDDGSAAIVWAELTNQGSQLRLRTVTPKGLRSVSAMISASAGSGFPRLAYDQGELFCSWTKVERGTPQVQISSVNTHAQESSSPR